MRTISCIPLWYWIWAVHGPQTIGDDLFHQIQTLCENWKMGPEVAALPVQSELLAREAKHCRSFIQTIADRRTGTTIFRAKSCRRVHQICSCNRYTTSDDDTRNRRSEDTQWARTSKVTAEQRIRLRFTYQQRTSTSNCLSNQVVKPFPSMPNNLRWLWPSA